jgi:hypothetical protein
MLLGCKCSDSSQVVCLREESQTLVERIESGADFGVPSAFSCWGFLSVPELFSLLLPVDIWLQAEFSVQRFLNLI